MKIATEVFGKPFGANKLPVPLGVEPIVSSALLVAAGIQKTSALIEKASFTINFSN